MNVIYFWKPTVSVLGCHVQDNGFDNYKRDKNKINKMNKKKFLCFKLNLQKLTNNNNNYIDSFI